MSLFDILLGRQRPVKSKMEKLFAIATARVTLEVKFNAKPTGKGGICFRPVTTSYFDEAEAELNDLLSIATRETGTRAQSVKDTYGYRWVLLIDDDFEDLVATFHMVSQTLQEHGFGEQLLAAVFQFVDDHQQQLYWIYNYKRGNFYPFVPLPNKARDNAYELRLRAVMEKEMPVEAELERWYPLWDIPFNQESTRSP
ncbi:MAG: hypothetical protein M1343_11810 [Chloroflexi bacterium]|nr:hypothetical protein [Chloroflexota bacterium]MDA8189165.1 hypothetical protein [Dehalococcoidales bacterium]